MRRRSRTCRWVREAPAAWLRMQDPLASAAVLILPKTSLTRVIIPVPIISFSCSACSCHSTVEHNLIRNRLSSELHGLLQVYRDGTHLVTASTDKQVKLVDTQTLEVLKVFNTDRPANAAALSPIFDQARTPLNRFPRGGSRQTLQGQSRTANCM